MLKLKTMIACVQCDREAHVKRITHHEQGCHNPIENNAESNLDPYLTMCKDAVKSLILDFAKDRVHHY
jgi:hypothetical protein